MANVLLALAFLNLVTRPRMSIVKAAGLVLPMLRESGLSEEDALTAFNQATQLRTARAMGVV